MASKLTVKQIKQIEKEFNLKVEHDEEVPFAYYFFSKDRLDFVQYDCEPKNNEIIFSIRKIDNVEAMKKFLKILEEE